MVEQSWDTCKFGGEIQRIRSPDFYECRHPAIVELGCYRTVKVSNDDPLHKDYPFAAVLFPDKRFADKSAIERIHEISSRELDLKCYVEPKIKSDDSEHQRKEKLKIVERALAGCRHCKLHETR